MVIDHEETERPSGESGGFRRFRTTRRRRSGDGPFSALIVLLKVLRAPSLVIQRALGSSVFELYTDFHAHASHGISPAAAPKKRCLLLLTLRLISYLPGR